MLRVNRAAPYLLFAGVTVAVFWKFLLFGQTMYAMSALEQQLGLAPQEPQGWFRSEFRHTRISDNLALLALHHRLYNEGLHRNTLALWNPYLFCGLPTSADPMIHPFYPPNLVLHRFLGPDAAYQISSMLHLFFAGVAMHLLLRALGRSDAAAAAGGLVWMLGGYQAMWFSTSILAGLSVFGPLAARFLIRGAETRTLGAAPIAGAFMGLAILGSHPQHAILFFLFLLAWSLFVLKRAGHDARFSLSFTGLFAIFSIGVGIVEVLARLDSIENGYRDPQFDHLSLYAEPLRLATYATGLILGKAYFPGPGWEAEFSVYMGLAAVSLAVVAAWRHRGETHILAVAVAAVGALALAFVYPLAWLYLKIPLLSLSPASRCLHVAAFGIAFLAAQGLDDLAASPGKAWKGVAWVAVAFVLLLIPGFEPFRFRNGAALETAIGFALAAAATAVALRSRPAALGLLFAAILFELLPPFLQFNHHADSSLIAQTPEVLRGLPKPGDPTRVTGILGTTAVSTKSPQWGNDLVTGNNLLALYRLENIGGFEAILPSAYVDFALAAGGRLSPAGRTIQFTNCESPLLDFIGLETVLLPASMPMPSRFRKTDLGPVARFENGAVLARARLASRIRAVKTPEEALALLREPQRDLKWETIIETDRALPVVYKGEIVWTSRASDRSELQVITDAPAVLVVADTDYPGWEATVDGTPTPILRANLAFRAVELPGGTHRVEFRFRPAFARFGLPASLFFLVLAPLAAWRWRKP